MPISTKQFLEGLEPPAFEHEGVVYMGRHLSVVEWLRQVQALDRLTAANAAKDILAIERGFRYFVRLFFPGERAHWWNRYRPSEAERVFFTLALPVQDELLKGFFNSQARALGMTIPTLGTTGSSNPSRKTGP